MSNKSKALLNLLSGVLSQVIAMVAGILIPRLFLTHFGSESNGFLNSIAQIFTYFALFEAGIGAVAMQALYAPVANGDKKKISSIVSAINKFYTRTGILYISSVLIMSIVYPLVVSSEVGKMTMFWVIIFNGLCGAVSYLFQGKMIVLLRTEGKNYLVSFIQMMTLLFINTAKIVLIIKGFNLIIVNSANLIFNILQIIVYEVYFIKNYAWLDLKAEPDLSAVEQKNSAFIHQISGLVFSSTDIIMLTFFLGDLKIVSVYSIYNLVVSMLNRILSQLAESVKFRLGQLYGTNKEKYMLYHHLFEAFNMCITFAVYTVTYLMLSSFIALYTRGVKDTNYLLPYLPLLFVLIQLLSNARISSQYLIEYAGHFKKTVSRTITETVINLTVTIISIQFFGIYGALIGTIVALLYRSNDMVLYSYKYIINKKPFETYKRWFINFLVFFVAVYVSKYLSLFVDNYFLWAKEAFIVSIIVFPSFVIIDGLSDIKYIREFLSLRKG